MKKSRKLQKRRDHKIRQSRVSGKDESVDAGRRSFLSSVRNGAIGLATVGGVGFFVTRNVQSSMHEHDLTRIGNGVPTVVQIHDPQCTVCAALQRETRKALKRFDSDAIDFVVANIRTDKGRGFANSYGVPHVTLLLFDADGELKRTLQGRRFSAELEGEFVRLVDG